MCVNIWLLRCRYPVNRCGGRITTKEETVVKVSEHSHASDVRQAEKRVALSEIRMKAANSNSPPRRIIRSTTAKINTASAVQMPSYNTLCRNIRRLRKNANTTPTIPLVLSDLVLSEPFTRTVKGDLFLLHDNNADVNRVVIFGTKETWHF